MVVSLLGSALLIKFSKCSQARTKRRTRCVCVQVWLVSLSRAGSEG